MAGDASGVQRKKILSVLKDRPIPWGSLGDRATLGAALGRGPISAVAVTTESFARAILERLAPDTRTSPGDSEE